MSTDNEIGAGQIHLWFQDGEPKNEDEAGQRKLGSSPELTG